MTAHFELAGEFRGFIRTIQGKRRLLVRTHEGDVQLKIPRSLRHQLDRHLAAGSVIAVSGFEHREHGGELRRDVLRVRVVAANACFTCPIQVCTKKNCWRQGGRELWHALEHELAKIDDAPNLEAVDCLDRCKRAPNFDCGNLEFEHATPDRARHFVHDLSGMHPGTRRA